MFVIDNFIKDEVFLKELNDNKFDFFSMFIDNYLDYKGAWWKGWSVEKARNLNERLIEYIHYTYDFVFEIYDKPISGIEYWTHIHSTEKSLTISDKKTGDLWPVLNLDNYLNWHVNKDEATYHGQKKLVVPMTSMVMWPFEQDVENGFLEITNAREKDIPEQKPFDKDPFRCECCDRSHEQFAVERIKPKYNRLVVFDGSYLHRVTPVTKGTRWSFAVDIWDTETSMAGEGVLT